MPGCSINTEWFRGHLPVTQQVIYLVCCNDESMFLTQVQQLLAMSLRQGMTGGILEGGDGIEKFRVETGQVCFHGLDYQPAFIRPNGDQLQFMVGEDAKSI